MNVRKERTRFSRIRKRNSFVYLLPSIVIIASFFANFPFPAVFAEFYSVESLLKSRDNYYFWTNPGNLGDMLINYAEIQLLSRLNVNFVVNMTSRQIDHPFNLILGGGGRFISPYMCGRDTYELLKSPNLKSCIMLSASIFGCDDLLDLFDERFTILCREARSFEYCIRRNNRARFVHANDMAFYINISKVNFTRPTTEAMQELTNETETYLGYQYQRYTTAMSRVWSSTRDAAYTYKGKTVAFYFRNDNEKQTYSEFTDFFHGFDLPLIVWADNERIGNIGIWCRIFLAIIDSTDIIVTDRLHVGIGAFLMGKTAYIYDNNYGKVSGVFNTTLGCFDNVHLVSSIDGDDRDFDTFPLSPLYLKRGRTLSKLLPPFMNMSYPEFRAEYMRYSDINVF